MRAVRAVNGFVEVRLRLLGGFQCEVHGEMQKLPLASQRVIAFLAVQDGPVQRAFVAGSLWLDKDEHRAAANLRSALWRLTRIETPVVAYWGTSLALREDVVVDVREFTSTAYRIVNESTGSEDGASLWSQLSLFGHSLLPDWYEDWLDLERERLRQLRLNALDKLSGVLLAGGRLALAVDAACTSISSEPLRESAHRALIAAHLVAGNRAEALRQYERFRRTLGETVGLEPSEELRSLIDHACAPA
jgi:DNA-binding SARP family transcriptional activator